MHLALGALLIWLMPAEAATQVPGPDLRPWPLSLRAQMLRLAEVDWRLRKAAAPVCPRHSAGTGLWLDHAAAYAERDRGVLSRTLRLRDAVQVAAVAPGSPADNAGIRPGDELVAIEGKRIADAPGNPPEAPPIADALMDRLAEMSPARPITLLVRRGGTTLAKRLVLQPTCAGRTILETGSSLAAHGDAGDLALTTALLDFAATDDELALIVGHELAHFLIVPPPGEGPAQIETRADLIGARLAYCAGYDVSRGAGLWPRYRRQDGAERLRLPTHPSAERREDAIRAALPGLACPLSLPPTVGPRSPR